MVSEGTQKSGTESVWWLVENQLHNKKAGTRFQGLLPYSVLLSRHILIKFAKIKHKEKILKAAREKQQITYKGTPIRLTADFSAETLQARREWHDIFKVMKEKNLQPRLLYPAKISFRFDGEIKSFTDKQKLRDCSTTKPALQQMLKELL